MSSKRQNRPFARLVERQPGALRILAALAQTGFGRFAGLAGTTGFSPVTVRRLAAALIAAGLARRHGGYGHPMRPELVLTPDGHAIAAQAATLVALADQHGAGDLLLRKRWRLPVLPVLAAGPRRFHEINAALGGLSPRSLSLALHDVTAAALATRDVIPAAPPFARYALTPPGNELAEAWREVVG